MVIQGLPIQPPLPRNHLDYSVCSQHLLNACHGDLNVGKMTCLLSVAPMGKSLMHQVVMTRFLLKLLIVRDLLSNPLSTVVDHAPASLGMPGRSLSLLDTTMLGDTTQQCNTPMV